MGRSAVDRRADSVRLHVRLTPRGGRDQIDGPAPDQDGGTVLKVRVAAPPVDGQANAALVKLIAKSLGVSKSRVSIASGETARVKTVEITGPVSLPPEWAI